MTLHVTKADYEMTGGGCYTFWSELNDGRYIVFNNDYFGYLDSNYGEVMTQEFFDKTGGDSTDWEEEHTLVSVEYPFTRKEMRLIRESLKLLNLDENFLEN